MSFIIGLLAIAIGLALLFAGYRLLWVLLPIWGFFAGLWLGITGLQAIFGTGFLAGVSGLVVGFVLGIVFAVLSYLFYIVGVAILGATIGYSLTVGPGDGPVAHGGLLDYDPAHGLRLSTPGGGLAPTPDGGYQFGLTLAAGEF